VPAASVLARQRHHAAFAERDGFENRSITGNSSERASPKKPAVAACDLARDLDGPNPVAAISDQFGGLTVGVSSDVRSWKYSRSTASSGGTGQGATS